MAKSLTTACDQSSSYCIWLKAVSQSSGALTYPWDDLTYWLLVLLICARGVVSHMINRSLMNPVHDAERRPAGKCINPLKPHSNGPLYSNTVIGTLAADGWAVHFGTARRAWAGCDPVYPLLVVTNVTAHPSATSVPTSYYSIWHYNYLCILKARL